MRVFRVTQLCHAVRALIGHLVEDGAANTPGAKRALRSLLLPSHLPRSRGSLSLNVGPQGGHASPARCLRHAGLGAQWRWATVAGGGVGSGMLSPMAWSSVGSGGAWAGPPEDMSLTLVVRSPTASSPTKRRRAWSK